MKQTYAFLALVLCVYLVCADPVTTNHYNDILGSVNCDRLSNLTRVVKKAIVTYTYTLNAKSPWGQFPDLTLSFYVPFSQFVRVVKNIVTVQST